MRKRGIVITASIACVLVVGLAIWLGGRERWEVAGLNGEFSDSESSVILLEEKLQEEPESIFIKYNLAYLYYKSGRFEEARDQLNKIIGSGEKSNALSKKVFYNMGNSLFRLAEIEEDMELVIKLLGESLRHYRTVIEIEKQEQAYSGLKSKVDEDTTVNYAIVQRRIKILTDKLEKKKRETEQQKGIYQLVKELLGKELEIHKRLVELKRKQQVESNLQERNYLLKQRSENRKRLQLIEEKIEQDLGATTKPPSARQPGKMKSI
jgi:tetratricopeptide (TPR) repeat protein